MKALVLSASPRRDGNSSQMALAAMEGLKKAQHDVELIYVDDVLKGLLRDCRTCRNDNGQCTIQDDYGATFLNKYLPADGAVFATPVYWYGMAAQLKAFFDRMFCYVSASYADSDSVVEKIQGKRLGLLISSEETFPTVDAGIVHQIQEFARYTSSTFVGLAHGVGNSRTDIVRDPNSPLEQAYNLGHDLLAAHSSDYKIDTPRSGKVWN